MSSPQIFVFLVADLVFSGLLSNGFILTVIIRELIKCRSFASSEQLLLSLALSNTCTTVIAAPFLYASFFMGMAVYNSSIFVKIFSSTFFIIMIRFWFTAWLCLFYCVKIVNSTHSLFRWCKMRISWIIPRLLIGSLVFSCFVSFFLLGLFPTEHKNNTANVTNMTQSKTMKYNLGSFRFFFFAVGSCSPLLVVLFCCITVVASLFRHIYRMARNTSSFKDLQTKAHIKAAGVVLSLFSLYVSFFVAQTFTISVTVVDASALYASVVMIMYSPAQAAILILSNPKLKQAFSQLLQRERSGQAKCASEIP